MKQTEMLWLKELYVGASVKDREKQIRRRLFKRPLQPDLQVLFLSGSKTEQLEILPAVLFCQKHFPRSETHVLGIAGGRDEAFLLVQQIAEETFRETGDADMRAYLLTKEYRKSRG